MRTGIFIGAILLAVFFHGCLYSPGANEIGTPSASISPAPPVPVTPTPSAAPSVSIPAELPFIKIDLIISGGITGAYRKEIQVSKDGVVYVDDNGRVWTKALSSGELFAFSQSMLSSGIFSAVSSNLSTCPDAYDEYLVAEVADKKKKFEKGGYCPGSSPEFERAEALVEALAT